MTRRLPLLLALALTASACATAPVTTAAPAATAPVAVTAPAPAPLSLLGRQLDSIARAAYPAGDPGAAILVRRGDETLLRAGYGMADLELAVPLRAEHVFRIGSLTKQFTGAAVLRLAEQGKLSLDDDITRWFPEWPTHGHRISVEALLNHTSGIRSYTAIPAWRALWRSDLTVDSLVALFRDQPMDFAPGERWAYNNSAYVLLGAIIEKASGRSYEEYVEQEFFAPLGMAHSRYGRNEELVPGMAKGYVRSRDGWAHAPYLSLTQPYAAGSLLSTIDDLDLWYVALKADRVLGAASRQRGWTPARLKSGLDTGYGFGWMVGRAFDRPSVEHSGGIHGFTTYQLWLPEEDLRVYVLSNTNTPRRSPGAVALDLAHAALGAPEPPAAVAATPETLQQYVGVYDMGPEGRREVLRRGDTLFTRVGNADAVRLAPVARDEFVVAGAQHRLRFERPAGGPVAGLLFRPRLGAEARGPRIATEVAERVEVQLAAEVLDRYVGTYQATPELRMVVRREGSRLVAEPSGQPPRALRAHSATEFVPEGLDARVVFEVDATGRATALVIHQGGQTVRAPRVE